MRVLLIGLVVLLTGCTTPLKDEKVVTLRFTTEKIDKLRIGMPASEVREMFGPANEVSTAVCGGATAGGQWVCETWTYRDKNTYRSSNFRFSVKQEEKTLNSWDVKR